MSFTLRLVIVALLSFVIQFYFISGITGSLKTAFPGINRKCLKMVVWSALVFANLYLIIALFYLIYNQFSVSRAVFPPPLKSFDYIIQFPFWIYILIVVQSILFFAIVDVFRFILILFSKKLNSKLKFHFAAARLIIALLFIIYVPIRTYYDYSTVSTRIVEYKKEGLPERMHNFKIVLISDVQADRYTDEIRLSRYIEAVNNTNPDLVLIAGDVITSTPDYINVAAEQLGKIQSKYGVYSCVGDHDNWAYRQDTERSLREIKAALISRNVRMIDNEKLILPVDSSRIGITFITNTYVERIEREIIDSLTNHLNGEDLRIFLTHQPRDFLIEQAGDSNYDLFFAGHTHGGQLTFFFPFINLTPTLIETRYVKGDFHIGDMLAIVNRGLGMSLAPIRYNSTPEITLIVLNGR